MAIGIDSLDEISATIKDRRKAAGISQVRLAKMCGLSQSTIARIETDISSLNPSYSTVYQIINALTKAKEAKGDILSRKAKEIMHRHIIYIKPTNTVADAIGTFRDYDFPQLPVLDNSRHVIGTVYQKDLLTIATENPEVIRRKQVGSMMKGALPQVGRDAELTGLKPILESAGAVIVVKDGKAIGIITIYDMLKGI